MNNLITKINEIIAKRKKTHDITSCEPLINEIVGAVATHDLLPDIELVSDKVHEAWMESKRQQGVNTRKAESGEELMVPYSKLTEASKQLDRNSVIAVYNAIKTL